MGIGLKRDSWAMKHSLGSIDYGQYGPYHGYIRAMIEVIELCLSRFYFEANLHSVYSENYNCTDVYLLFFEPPI